jgi:predicted nuclease of predicted toxin-antitoxin system
MKRSSLKFLADENVPLATVTKLRQAGHDIYWIAEEAAGLDDLAVWQLAAEQQAVLITFDRDFGRLMIQAATPRPKGVIYCRFIPVTPAEAGELILKVLGYATVSLGNHFTTLERERLRSRKM